MSEYKKCENCGHLNSLKVSDCEKCKYGLSTAPIVEGNLDENTPETTEINDPPFISGFLVLLGWITIALGVIAGAYLMSGIATSGYNTYGAKQSTTAFGIGLLFSSVVSGAVIIGLGTIIKQLHEIKIKTG